MTSFSRMSLYALTVKPPSATQDAILGDFIGGKSSRRQQILTANGSRLSLLRIIEKPFSFTEIHSQDVFAVVRRIAKFRIAGGTKGMSLPSLRATSQFSDFPKHTTPAARSCLSLPFAGLDCNSV